MSPAADVLQLPVSAGAVHAFMAPIDRATSMPAAFDVAACGRFALDQPPAPWVSLGTVDEFTRSSTTEIVPLWTGAPASVTGQARKRVGAEVRFAFAGWSKLAQALSAGTQQLNVLVEDAGAAVAAMAVGEGSTAAVLQLGEQAAALVPGSFVAVDVDSAGQTGFVGSGVSGAYLTAAVSDVDYVRRVTLNVGEVASVDGGAVTLRAPLLAGTPVAGMKASAVAGFCDRDGSSFFQEWSGLFVMDGAQGERVLLYYPRLSPAAATAETAGAVCGAVLLRLSGHFRALPVRDALDGEMAACYRTYLPTLP